MFRRFLGFVNIDGLPTFSDIDIFTGAISLIFTLPKHSVSELLQIKIETIGFSRFVVHWTQTDELDNQPKYMFTTHILNVL